MRNFALTLGVLALLLSGRPARAVMGTIDDVPAATLLLPYFEVDPNGTAAKGVTTLLTINNASASATLNHVTVWSNLAVPVVAFDFYLTGYDAQTMDLQQVLGGVLPQTASAGQDPMDVISNHGPISQDINFASCSGQLPPPPNLTSDYVDHIRAALTGNASSILGGCAGRGFGDGIMRGYLTVDVVNACSLLLPGDPGYFINGGGGIAGNRNILFGDYLRLDKATRRGWADNLVSIEADAMNPETNLPGQYTFYGRLVGFSAADNREPLATTFMNRFFNGTTGYPQNTSLVVWRDPKTPQPPFDCNNPPWFPLSQEQVVVFDEEENPEESPSSPVAPPPPGTALIPFPGAAQRVRLGGADFPVGLPFGVLYLNLNTTVTTAGANPAEDPAAAQAWVTVVQEDADTGAYGIRGQTSFGYRAVALDNATKANHIILPVP